MTDERIHLADSADGTRIAAKVVGAGPPLVFLPAGPATSEASWRFVVPHLSDRFTCYLADTRGRGLSAAADDHRPQRLYEDVTAFIETLEAPAGLVEWGSDLWGGTAMAAGRLITAVAAYDTGVAQVMSPAIAPRFEAVIAGVAERAGQGKAAEAAEFLIERSGLIYSDEDYRGDAVQRFWREAAPSIPVFVRQLLLAAESSANRTTDPDVLSRVDTPVLLLQGARSNPWFADSVAYLATHLPRATVRTIDAAHFAPYTAPQALAQELGAFFAAASPQPGPMTR
jgi:pimeloyl-ACP methyl ester carboxylesterase